MRLSILLLCCFWLFSCGDKPVAGPKQGYFFLTTPKTTRGGGEEVRPYDREIQFNQEYIVAFKRGFDRKQVLREVYEVRTHKLYRFLTHHKTWLVYVEEHPESLIDVASNVAQDYYDSRIVSYEKGNKTIRGFETQCLLYRDKEGNPKKMWIMPTVPFYLNLIPAFAKHVKGMPVEMAEDSGLDQDFTMFSMTYFDPNVSEAAFSTSMSGYIQADKQRFEAALMEVVKENNQYTDIDYEERLVWENNLRTLFLF